MGSTPERRLHEAGATVVSRDVLRPIPSAQCRKRSASLKSQAAPGASGVLQDRENDQYDRTPEGTILKEVIILMSWENKHFDPNANPSRRVLHRNDLPVWKAQIDEIPYGAPYVQANVTQTVGTISVTGECDGREPCSRGMPGARTRGSSRKATSTSTRCGARTSIAAEWGPAQCDTRTEFTFSGATVSLTVQS